MIQVSCGVNRQASLPTVHDLGSCPSMSAQEHRHGWSARWRCNDPMTFPWLLAMQGDNARVKTHGAALADDLEVKLREIEATLRQASDAQWRAVCASEGWPVGLVAFHLALHMERPAGWVEDALAGKPPFEFSFAETDALNAAVAGYGIVLSKGFVLGALAGAGSRIQAALHAITDADLERDALIQRSR